MSACLGDTFWSLTANALSKKLRPSATGHQETAPYQELLICCTVMWARHNTWRGSGKSDPQIKLNVFEQGRPTLLLEGALSSLTAPYYTFLIISAEFFKLSSRGSPANIPQSHTYIRTHTHTNIYMHVQSRSLTHFASVNINLQRCITTIMWLFTELLPRRMALPTLISVQLPRAVAFFSLSGKGPQKVSCIIIRPSSTIRTCNASSVRSSNASLCFEPVFSHILIYEPLCLPWANWTKSGRVGTQIPLGPRLQVSVRCCFDLWLLGFIFIPCCSLPAHVFLSEIPTPPVYSGLIISPRINFYWT